MNVHRSGILKGESFFLTNSIGTPTDLDLCLSGLLAKSSLHSVLLKPSNILNPAIKKILLGGREELHLHRSGTDLPVLT